MLKFLTLASLGSAFVCGMAATASAETLRPPAPPGTRYVLPGAAAGYPGNHLQEGRSIYRMEAPSTFWYGTDERGYPNGEPQNPRSGD